jgi:dTDP-4-amino-4,6-dideoxygalactose transaminase
MANKIKFLDLTKQYKSIKKEINSAIKKVLESCVFIGGKEVEDFEKKIAKFCGAKYAISVNSGTDALFLSLKALGIGQRDEVITTPFTFISTAEVIATLGAKPVFVDIEPRTFNIDPEKIEEKISKKTRAIIPVHLFGQMADMAEIIKIAKKHKLKVIEDTAQAIGAKLKVESRKWKVAGSIGDLGCFSFFPSKNLGAYGDGGMVVTNNKKLAEKIRLLKNHGSSSKEKYLNLVSGINSRLDTIQAAILRVKFKYLKKWTQKRQEIAKYYNQKLSGVGDVIIPEISSERTHIFHQYTIRTKYRDKLQKYLKEKGIPTMIYYPLPLHLQPAFKYLGYKKGDFSESEKAAQEVLSLPIYPELSQKEQDFIIRKIKEFYENQN